VNQESCELQNIEISEKKSCEGKIQNDLQAMLYLPNK
jgi:hypothetical protein